MAVVVFDLDMTIIDSSHRHASKPDGSIDLAHWFQNATPERIAQDTLLPLARVVPTIYNDGNHKVVFCTARCMQPADHKFLADNFDAIPHHELFSRPGHFVTPDSPEYANSYHGFVGDTSGDGALKLRQITEYIRTLGGTNFYDTCVMLFEDNQSTMDLFMKHGATCYDAKIINRKMKAK